MVSAREREGVIENRSDCMCPVHTNLELTTKMAMTQETIAKQLAETVAKHEEELWRVNQEVRQR